MFINRQEREKLDTLFQHLKLQNEHNESGMDKAAKIGQILAFLEMVQAQIKKYSTKRKLVFVDCGAGNCYLSFLVYYYFTHFQNRQITIHCIDNNVRLMEKNLSFAGSLGFTNMHFHGMDINDFNLSDKIDLVYSLHACDTATDKTLFLGLRHHATCILSVSCCQHTIRDHIRRHAYTGITKHRVFKDKLVYMIGDSLRALLLEKQGYQVDIIEFVSSRYTDKNILLRARKSNPRDSLQIDKEYASIRNEFNVVPRLEAYLTNPLHMK